MKRTPLGHVLHALNQPELTVVAIYVIVAWLATLIPMPFD